MGSHLNFKNIGSCQPVDASGAKLMGSSPLTRQPSIYSLTFDEFQNTWGGGLGRDFGSMNMDELLKSIWTAEENQAITSSVGGREEGAPGGNLQRQGSLTLPRTLSQRTVDEVWKNLIKENSGGANATGGAGSNLPQRQQTLGEMTLEEFLARAGVVREETQQIGSSNNNGLLNELSGLNNTGNNGLMLGFQQPNQTNGFVATQTIQNGNNLVTSQPASLAHNVSEIKSSLHQSQLRLPLQQQQPIFPKPANMAFAPPMPLGNSGQLSTPGVNNNLVHNGAMGVVSLGTGGVTIARGSPRSQISPDLIPKSNADSPVPYVFSRGRKASAALEKVVERRQRRMIKNRESAARSRARKQAYTLELEAEVTKLKELNQELQRKQGEIMEMQKNQLLATMNPQWGGKRQCLRRTLTGPW